MPPCLPKSPDPTLLARTSAKVQSLTRKDRNCPATFIGDCDMLSYVMLGCTDVKRATKFYNSVLGTLGYVPSAETKSYAAYGTKSNPEKIQFYVTKPYNKKPATAGNGTMITFKARSRKAVDQFHAAALALGASDEGKPGLRPVDGNDYYAYVRDQDGNKLCAHSSRAS